MWLHGLVGDTLVKYRVLKHSETLKNLEQNIEIRVTPTGPPIQTMTVLLGAKQYIIVNKKLVERTENRELEALITHEAYHLQNRDLLMNTFAGLTGIFFGGKNVLLALYDYPAKEREADKRAVEQTSKDELINGIQKSYELLSERNRHPGTQNPKRLADRGPMRILQEGIVKSVKRDIKRLYNWLLRTYAIFFGKVLLDKAHLGKEDRIQYINQINNNE
jgi:predicted metal-dependent hydrolase